MKTIMVEPGQLETTAIKIEAANADYDRYYQNIYVEIDKMSNYWNGKDNVAFVNQIKNFENDLKQISIIMREYAAFLRNSARGYRETQQENYLSASKLRRI